MAKPQDHAWIAVRVGIPPDHAAEQVVAEIRNSIGFDKPIVVLLGIAHIEQGEKGTDPVIIWTPHPAAKEFLNGYLQDGPDPSGESLLP